MTTTPMNLVDSGATAPASLLSQSLVVAEHQRVAATELPRLLREFEQQGLRPINLETVDGASVVTVVGLQQGSVIVKKVEIAGTLAIGDDHGRGMCVVLLGPDGVGKSTTKAKLLALLKPAFASQHTCHYRPRTIGRIGPGRPVSAPHSQPARSYAASIGYAVTVFADHWLAYFLRLRRLMRTQCLIIFDRSYVDILIDPVRYRYGGPKRLIEVLKQLLPIQQCLYVVLDADPTLILTRKTELGEQELIRQREAYCRWAAGELSAVVVKNESDVDSTVTKLFSAIVEYLTLRFKKSHPEWYSEES
jgi:thymidylate kinase